MKISKHDKWTLLGFDAREMWSDASLAWPESRRARSLFRIDVIRPLSVDTQVWHSVFDVAPKLERPAWVGPVQQHWDNLETMKNFLARRHLGLKNYWVIGIAKQFKYCGDNREAVWEGRLSEIQPDYINTSWKLLGYDVADPYLESSLMNGVLDPDSEDVEIIRQIWAPELNAFHLFEQIEGALKFRDFSDSRSPEHAPFCVYSIWKIPN